MSRLFRNGHDCLMDGHRFEARYDREPTADFRLDQIALAALDRVLDAATKRTYVRDVCVRCGKTIERTDAMAPGRCEEDR